MADKTFLVIDANSVIHRAFHAMPALTNKKDEGVGAVYGFVLALFRAIEDFRPQYVAACFDTKAPTFRRLEFKDYKAQRPATAPELVPQIKTVQDLLPELGVAVFALDGFEADDLIASVIKSAKDESARLRPETAEGLWRGEKIDKIDFYVLTGDYDSLQLVDDRVKAFIVNRGIKNAVVYDSGKVKEKFGVPPGLVPDFKALAGDPSDNIPGAPGVGPKAAARILAEYGGLRKFYDSPPAADKTGQILLDNKEKILGFLKLTTMRPDAPVGAVLEACKFDNFNGDRPRAALLGLGLASLAKRLPQGKISRNATLF